MSAMISVVDSLVRQFDLKPHPEGGYYRETYRCDQRILRAPSGAERCASTAIYYLLNNGAYSAWHRIASDEVWHFYAGSPLDVHALNAAGQLVTQRLGNALETSGAMFQAVVPAGCWFAAELVEPDGYAFVGCTVAPGFEFSEFELADSTALLDEYAQYAPLIQRLS